MCSVSVTAGVHLNQIDDPEIACKTQRARELPSDYPVLKIGPATIWPTVGQLAAIRDAIDGWLASEDGRRLAGSQDELTA